MYGLLYFTFLLYVGIQYNDTIAEYTLTKEVDHDSDTRQLKKQIHDLHTSLDTRFNSTDTRLNKIETRLTTLENPHTKTNQNRYHSS